MALIKILPLLWLSKVEMLKKIIKAVPSIFNNKPVWIVSYFNNKNKLCYETLSYKNGKSLQLIANI